MEAQFIEHRTLLIILFLRPLHKQKLPHPKGTTSRPSLGQLCSVGGTRYQYFVSLSRGFQPRVRTTGAGALANLPLTSRWLRWIKVSFLLLLYTYLTTLARQLPEQPHNTQLNMLYAKIHWHLLQWRVVWNLTLPTIFYGASFSCCHSPCCTIFKCSVLATC